MKLLVDTHVFIWFILDAPQLGPRAKALLMDPAHERFLSVVSVWEVVIKHDLGKLKLAEGVSGFLGDIEQAHFQVLDLTVSQVAELSGLPLHHRDPFDRMLIAQARSEGMDLLTSDAAFGAYDLKLIDASR